LNQVGQFGNLLTPSLDLRRQRFTLHGKRWQKFSKRCDGCVGDKMCF
jgi:hypothetical protein